MKKKIGVFTLGNARENYGQILQAYALQEFLRKSNYEPFLINYRRRFTLEDERGGRKLMKAVYLFVKGMVFPKSTGDTKLDSISVVKRDFVNFYKDNFVFSQLYTTIDELKRDPPKAEVYICGSDQIWNWDNRYGYDKASFLQFGDKNIKKVSYAAGMSRISNDSRAIKELNKYLNVFNNVSLREDTGVPILNKAGIFDVNVVLDPTLLLDKEHYFEKMSKPIDLQDTAYILGYLINFSSPQDIGWDKISSYLGESGLDFKYVSAEGYVDAVNKLGEYESSFYTVSEWLYAVANSKYVLTTSYHGLLFSIIFEKPFIFYFADNNHSYGRNRIYYILGLLGLEQRIFQTDKPIKDQIEDPIDWVIVKEKLRRNKDFSIDFLINSIEN